MDELLEMLPKAKEELRINSGDAYRITVGLESAEEMLGFLRSNPYENVILEVSRFIEPKRFHIRKEGFQIASISAMQEANHLMDEFSIPLN